MLLPEGLQKDRVQEQKISLMNILTCIICTNKASQAHICPNCSKFYCELCIKSHLQSKTSECPNCKKQIQISSLVNCHKLSQELSSALETLIQFQSPSKGICTEHNLGLSYFCKQCEKPLCSDCIVIGDIHKGHTFMKIEKKKIDYNEKVLCLLSRIRNKKKELEKKLHQIESQQETEQNINEKIESISVHIKKNIQSYKLNAHKNLNSFEEWLQNQTFIVNSRNKSYTDILNSIQEMTKVQLLNKNQKDIQNIIISSMADSDKNKSKKMDIKKLEKKIQNQLIPKFTENTFILDNYTNFREKKQVIYSDVFYDGLNEWRLKIYPNGIDGEEQKKDPTNIPQKQRLSSKKEEYISVYIQLKSAIRRTGRYRHKIQIVNQIDASKIITQTYESDFEVGECWGYDHFANISFLYRDNYVHPKEDSLKIIVSVCAPTYYYLCKDLSALINNKETQKQNNRKIIQQMKEKLMCQNGNKRLEITNYQEKKNQRVDHKNFDYKKYAKQRKSAVEITTEEISDHQSAELKKIYRNLSKCKQHDLLIF